MPLVKVSSSYLMDMGSIHLKINQLTLATGCTCRQCHIQRQAMLVLRSRLIVESTPPMEALILVNVLKLQNDHHCKWPGFVSNLLTIKQHESSHASRAMVAHVKTDLRKFSGCKLEKKNTWLLQVMYLTTRSVDFGTLSCVALLDHSSQIGKVEILIG